MATETRKSTAAIAPFGLRMQPELRAQIEAAAEAAGRSMNAEIVTRLEGSLTKGRVFTKEEHKLLSRVVTFTTLNVLQVAAQNDEIDIKWLIDLLASGEEKELLKHPSTRRIAEEAALRRASSIAILAGVDIGEESAD